MTYIQTNPVDTTKKYSSITIGLSSPEKILQRSFGEVLKPETINYRSYKPEKDGLFCEKIFGPVKDYECHCGKYKGIRYRGIICDRCGVEVTRKKVRRERMGHITLAVPVVHIWYLRSIPSKLSYLAGKSTKELERVIYYEMFMVIEPGSSGLDKFALIDEDEFLQYEEQFGYMAVSDDDRDNENYFYATMGGEAMKEMLSRLNIIELKNELIDIVKTSKSKQKRGDALKRLKVVKSFVPDTVKTRINKPDWMIVSILPVIPPELRPLVPLEGGRFAASDLNDLYRRIIIRNNRLKQLMEIKAPDVILRNEKRMLQEAVDALFDNNRRKTAIRSGSRRPLKSLSDMLRGKTGRFRQNLLGKRVDYSGRSVIVVGPQLQLHECGMPKNMALELFKPHMIHELMVRGYTQTPRSAKLMVENREPVVYKVLEYVVKDHPVLLNRAPTLHRLGIQAFQPVLVDGKAIQLHPLVCAAFNADFDGDQMAVHVPLALEAQMEARMLMLSSHNILHPANGQPIAVPSQDMVLGCYYLTRQKAGEKGEGKIFGSIKEGLMAFENKAVGLHTIVDLKSKGKWIKKTTVGRIIFNSILPSEIDYVNSIINKKMLTKIVNNAYLLSGNYQTVLFLDRLKDLGFGMATQSGSSIAISDVLIPEQKNGIIAGAQSEVDEIKNKFDRHILTDGERYNKVIDVWTHTANQMALTMMKALEEDREGFNPVFMMADSGARGSQDQIKQLAGMRGLMAKPQKSMKGGVGEIIESPITSNFKEGLSVFEYFISTHGARKGLADTALKTADAGYLTRRLVDVAQDVVVYSHDCGTINGIIISDLKEGEKIVEPLSDRILGRTILDDFISKGETVVKAGSVISENEAELIGDSGVENVRIRSILTCEAKRGCCAMCYGWDLSTHKVVDIGTAVGIRAAQSIGEPGTQLTLRTFHIGGTATRIIEQSEMVTKRPGKIKFSDNYDFAKTIDETGTRVTRCMVRHSKMLVLDDDGVENASFNIPYGSTVFVEDGEMVKAKTTLIKWDPYTDIILARETGYVSLSDFIEGETFAVEAVEGGKKQMVVVEARDRKLSPHIEIINKDGKILAGGTILPVKATLVVNDKQKVQRGQTLVKIPKDIGKSRDITGGLPRVAELFEARKPTNPAVMTEINGKIRFGETKRGIRKIHVLGVDGEERTYSIPYGKHVIVHEGDFVNAGTKLCEGAISPSDILHVLGPAAVRDYLVNEIQEVYRLQGVKIDDKHIEIIVGQMMQKVSVKDPGDTRFMNEDRVAKKEFFAENERIGKMIIVNEPGDSGIDTGAIIERHEFLEINKEVKAEGKKVATYKKPRPATFEPILMGITRASLNTESFISAASFQETTRVLTDASTAGKTDYLQGLKENVAVGRLIPAGTGTPEFDNLIVGSEKTVEDDSYDDAVA